MSPPEVFQAKQQIGLLGGTFDPPHFGHLLVADQVRTGLELDAVWLVPAGDPWQKSSDGLVTPKHRRLELTRAAVGDTPGLAVSSIEVDRDGPSYTIDTVTTLAATHPNTDWLLIMGADAANGLATWHRHEELAAMVEVVVVDRPGSEPRPPAPWRWRRVDVPELELSSSDIRSRFSENRSVRFMTPAEVIDRCRALGLYV